MKTPKEKAEELFKLFSDINYFCVGNIEYEHSKKCAILAIDELIIQNGEANLLFKIDKDYYQEMNGYLFQVKQEIEKL